MNLEGMTASAFLDVHGRFAKDAEFVTFVRVFYQNDDSPPLPNQTFEDITLEQFGALTAEEREQIRNAGSAAGLIDTEDKSNA